MKRQRKGNILVPFLSQLIYTTIILLSLFDSFYIKYCVSQVMYMLIIHSETPIMLIIHKSWCGACKGMETEFLKLGALHNNCQHSNPANVCSTTLVEGQYFMIQGSLLRGTQSNRHSALCKHIPCRHIAVLRPTYLGCLR